MADKKRTARLELKQNGEHKSSESGTELKGDTYSGGGVKVIAE